MSKYKVGDIVKLRDDLEGEKCYGTQFYNKEMNIMRGKPIKIETILDLFSGKSYLVFDETGYQWALTDEMIEGLWEECNNEKHVAVTIFESLNNNDNFPKTPLKLIDVLNKIANGELKEGTKVKHLNNIYIYKKYEGKEYASLYRETADSPEKDFFYDERHRFMSVILRDEVELIEPNHFTDVGKMAEATDNTKIVELKKYDFYIYDDYSDGYEEEEFVGTTEAIEILKDKLNEVIRWINKRG